MIVYFIIIIIINVVGLDVKIDVIKRLVKTKENYNINDMKIYSIILSIFKFDSIYIYYIYL